MKVVEFELANDAGGKTMFDTDQFLFAETVTIDPPTTRVYLKTAGKTFIVKGTVADVHQKLE